MLLGCEGNAESMAVLPLESPGSCKVFWCLCPAPEILTLLVWGDIQGRSISESSQVIQRCAKLENLHLGGES